MNRGILTYETIFSNDVQITFNEISVPLISIIIVSRNAPELLASTLCSLSGQAVLNRSSFEVIVVDNASGSDTRELLKRVTGARVHFSNENLGFGGGNNLGVSMARGRFILFLNPDIEMLPGALDAAVNAMTSGARIGIVGGRLLFPSGHVQETGALFKNDAQVAFPYLRGTQDPCAPEATYRHPTGYVSGAFLMIERDLFDRLNGFDPTFSPAYFEDTDLCVRAHRLDYGVVFEPSAVAFHFESATSENRAEVEKLLDRNRKIFRERHSKWLFSGPSGNEVSELSLRNFRNNEFRILYIDDEIPHLDNGAGHPRSNFILHQMVSLGYFVSLFPLHKGETKLFERYRDLPREIEILGGSKDKSLNVLIEARPMYYDIIWVSRPHNISIICEYFKTINKPLRDFVKHTIIFDSEAVYAARDSIKAIVRGTPIYGSKLRAAIEQELRYYAIADHVICVSQSEAELCREFGLANTRVLAHALTSKPDSPGYQDRSGLLFVGSLIETDSPNYDSLLWFIKHAWNLVRSKLGGDLTLTIVGAAMPAVKEQLSVDGVYCTGRVRDLAPLLDAARVMIAPTRFAAGIPHKVHESASRGLPSVVTPLLAEQVGWPS
ncbi:MAG: glycosyltransferase, partial [Methylocella sp.]